MILYKATFWLISKAYRVCDWVLGVYRVHIVVAADEACLSFLFENELHYAVRVEQVTVGLVPVRWGLLSWGDPRNEEVLALTEGFRDHVLEGIGEDRVQFLKIEVGGKLTGFVKQRHWFH